ncbi:hypothetical protein BDZ45DRAFT_798783 [Acephala macrosclerotiorum]|nr:hypothetical protein BDZ45DRAFT_798783 [Acephala macrosclerotiorum]
MSSDMPPPPKPSNFETSKEKLQATISQHTLSQESFKIILSIFDSPRCFLDIRLVREFVEMSVSTYIDNTSFMLLMLLVFTYLWGIGFRRSRDLGKSPLRHRSRNVNSRDRNKQACSLSLSSDQGSVVLHPTTLYRMTFTLHPPSSILSLHNLLLVHAKTGKSKQNPKKHKHAEEDGVMRCSTFSRYGRATRAVPSIPFLESGGAEASSTPHRHREDESEWLSVD